MRHRSTCKASAAIKRNNSATQLNMDRPPICVGIPSTRVGTQIVHPWRRRALAAFPGQDWAVIAEREQEPRRQLRNSSARFDENGRPEHYPSPVQYGGPSRSPAPDPSPRPLTSDIKSHLGAHYDKPASACCSVQVGGASCAFPPWRIMISLGRTRLACLGWLLGVAAGGWCGRVAGFMPGTQREKKKTWPAHPAVT